MNHNSTGEIKPDGPPVNWNHCLGCGLEMGPREERFKVQRGGKTVGIGHERCR